jgi:hypothetical protein
MSLTTCVRKAGKNLNAEDKAAILEAARANRKAGMSTDDAAKAAVRARLEEVQALLAAEGQVVTVTTRVEAPKTLKERAEAMAAPKWWDDLTPAERYFRLKAAGLADGKTASTPWSRLTPDERAAMESQWGPKTPAPTPSANTIFTEDAAAAARARLKAKLGRLQSGLDPETLMDGITLAGYHVEKGARTFAAYARAMVADMGDSVKPYLQQWYMALRADPKAAELKASMDKASAIEDLTAADIDALLVAGDTKPSLLGAEGRRAVARSIADRLIGGDPFTSIVQARKFIEDLTGTPVPAGTQQAKLADETVEVAVVMAARDIVSAGRRAGRSDDVIYDRLVRVYENQPSLNVRDSDSIRNQAYSTPAPLAFVTSRLARVRGAGKVGEPTGGNGMLLMEVAPEDATVNELNDDRAGNLRAAGFKVTQDNAATTALAKPKTLDSVVMNPPFGVVRDEGGKTITYEALPDYTTGEIDHAIVFKALDAMKDDGDAVLIIGGTLAESEQGRKEAYRGKSKREFFYNLQQQYNVVDHFTVGGDLYKKQGTTYPVDVVVIRGRGKSARTMPAADLPPIIDTWAKLKEKLNGNDVAGLGAAGSTVAGSDRGGQVGAADAPGVLESPGVPAQSAGEVSSTRGTGAGVRGDDASRPAGRPDRTRASRNDAAVGEPGRAGETAGDGGARPNADDADTAQRPAGAGRAGDGDAGRLGNGTGRSADRTRLTEADSQKLQVTYRNFSANKSVNTLVATNHLTALEGAFDKLRARVGDVDAYVRSKLKYDDAGFKKAFSAEQVEALALAIDNIEQGRGFIIGDQTGIGKGRVVAAMIRYAKLNGRTPVFVTQMPDLYGDMMRDLNDIGMSGFKPLMTNNNASVPLDAEALAWFGEVQAINTRVAELESAIADEVLKELGSEAKPEDLAIAIRTAMKASTNPEIVSLRSEVAELKASRPEKRGQFLETPNIDKHEATLAEFVQAGNIGDYGAIFTTYNQMAALDSGKPRRDKDGSKKDASAPKFAYRDTFLRRMVNQNAMLILDESHNAGAAGDGKFPKVGDVVRALVKSSGSVFYSSATFAKNPSVMDVYSKTDLGQAFTSSNDLARAIGTVPQQQVASAMLVEAGQYIRRERSFNGIEYKIDTVEADTKAPEDVSTAMRLTVEFDDAKRAALADIQNDLDAEGGVISAVTGGISTGSVESTNFTSVMHNVINTFLLSLKADAAADAAIEAIKRGEKPVLTVANTMEMFIKDYTLAAGLAVGDPLNASFADVLMRYLEKTRYARIKHANGEEERVWLSDRQLGPDGVEAYETAKGFIQQMRLSIPLSPIDYIKEKIQAAGFSIGEITGRQMVVEGGAIRPRNKAELNTAGKKNTIAKFNGGTLDALIINRSGSTGLSMHASETFADQRRRVMIVAQAELDINNHMQMLGRINRTGQVSQAKPGARQGTYGLPRYVQLTANVPIEMRPAAVLAAKMASLSANTTAGRKSSVEDSAAPDFMNKYGDEVAALMVGGDPGLNRRLGYPIKLDEDGVPSSQNAIARVTGRIGLLPLREQQAIYDTISQEYKDLIAQLDALGKNDLEAKTYPLEAKVLATETIIEGTGSSPFTSPVVAEKVDVRRLGKPYSSEKVRQFVTEALGGKTAEQQRRETMETFRREAQAEVAAARLEAKTDADQAAIKRLEEALQTAWVRFQQVAPFIGRPVVIKTTSNGNIYGVPISFERKKGAKSVGAMSSWRVRYAVVDGARVMTFPLSQVYADNAPALSDSAVVVQEATTMNVVNADKTGFDEVPVLDAFDRGQTEGRETRTVMTGNLLRASAKFPGRLMSYTTADGSVRQGLMTPATFDLAAAQAKLTPEMTDPTKIVDFLSRGGIIVDRETGGEIIRIRKTYRYEISTAKAGKGRKIATDAGLYMASAGSKMRGNLSVGDEGALTTFLGNVLKNQGIPLTTSADTKDLAGTPPKFSRTGPTLPEAPDSWLYRFWSSRTWDSEADARDMMRRRLVEDNERYAGMFKPNDPALVDGLIFEKAPTPKTGFSKGKPQVKLKQPKQPAQPFARIGEPADSEGDDRPRVDWESRDLADDGTADSVLQAYGRGKGNVYRAWVDPSLIPLPKGGGIVDGYPDMDGDYDWSELQRGRGSPPPLKLRVGKNGKLVLMDGNHRLAWWREQGHSEVPAYVIDERKGADDVPFSMAGLTFPEGTVSPRSLSAEVAKITANWDTDLATVKVVNRVEDLPEAIRQAVYNVGAENQVRGLAMPTGDVYLVAENIGSLDEGRFVLFHEVYGHVGMRAFLGDGYSMQMRTLKAANPSLAREAEAWFSKYGEVETQARIDAGMTPEKAAAAVRDLAVEEALADRAGDAPAIKGWQRLMAALQRALRRMGLGSVADMLEGMSEAETLALLVDARRTVSTESRGSIQSMTSPVFQRAYHGTAARVDKFSTDYMGTGEGAQAYGWGLYFASKREVADFYRKKLSAGGDYTLLDGKRWRPPVDAPASESARLDNMAMFMLQQAQSAAALEVLAKRRDADPAVVQRARELLPRVTWEPSGQLYEVDIPEDSEMLLWDKPLSEQPAKVREALKSLPKYDSYYTGGRFYEAVSSEWASRGGSKAASEALMAAGVKGIKYLDGDSRGAGDGTFNYVVFSGDDVAIREQQEAMAGVPAFSRATAQTATDAFKRWFGASVVTKDGKAGGEPLVVYHGTAADIDSFSAAKIGAATDSGGSGRGFYFAADPEYAGVYAGRKSGANIVPAYVSLKNPLQYEAGSFGGRASAIRSLGLEVPRGDPTQEWSERFTAAAQAKGYDGVLVTLGGKPAEVVAFRPEQIKSAVGNSGAFSPTNADIRFSRLTSQDILNPGGGVQDFSRYGKTKQDRLRGIIDKGREFYLGALTRDQIADVYGGDVPQVRDYDKLVRSMENERSSLAQRADEVYQRWAKIDAATSDKLGRIMLDATTEQVHPDSADKPADPAKAQIHARLRAQFKLLPPEVQAMYREVRDFHAGVLDDIKTALVGRIERQVAAGAERAALLSKVQQQFDQYLEGGPYFPLSRFGDYLVIATRPDGERVVAAYENAGEQQAAARELRADGFTTKMKTAKEYARSQDGNAGKFIGDVIQAVEKVDMVEATINGSRTDLKNQLLDDLNQLFIRSLPDLSYRKHFAHRKNTPGFSADVMRGFASSAFHAASYIARLNHADRMTMGLQSAYEAIDKADEGDFNTQTQVLNELSKRHESMLNPNTHPLSAAATQLGFVMYLGLSPAAGLINMLQVPMVTIPYLGAKYGFGKASAAMGKAYADIMKAPANRQSGFNAAQSLALSAEERKAISTLQDEGVIDLTQAHDLAAATDRDVGDLAKNKTAFAMARAMRIVGWTFHVPEVMNRQTTALMAYRLERERGADHETALEQARETIKRTQFDYSSSNRARYMQGNIARVVLQFKQFSQNMTYFLGRAAYQALKGESPEVRKIARRQILSTFVVTGTMAGSLGLPGIGAVMGAVGMLVSAMDDEDEPWDWQTEYRNALADQFGKEWGEVFAKGAPRMLMPWWDIAGRVSLNELWWRSNDREGQNPREAFATDMANILGPTAGTLLGWYTAADHMQRGAYDKAAEAVVPKFIRDPLKAYREADEGVTSYNGDPLMDVEAVEVFGRAMGFAPTRVSEMFEGRNAVMNAKTALDERRQRLLNKVVKARMDGDREAEAEARSDIAGFNSRNPDFKITNMTIARSLMTRRRNRENTEQGILLPDTKADLRERGRFANIE